MISLHLISVGASVQQCMAVGKCTFAHMSQHTGTHEQSVQTLSRTPLHLVTTLRLILHVSFHSGSSLPVVLHCFLAVLYGAAAR